MNSAVPSDTLPRLGTLMVWLGGGSWRDIDDPLERSAYQTAGFLVLLNAAIAWGVATFAVVGLAGMSGWAALPITLLCGLLVGVFGRILVTTPAEPGRRRILADLARGLVAVFIGIVVGEVAALAIFTGPVNRELSDQVDAARSTVAFSDRGRQLDQIRDDRAALDARVSAALQRRDEAQIVARCEYNPGPECPSNRITGDPGRGPEARFAQSALVSAESDLAAARAEREREAARLDAMIDRIDTELEADRDKAEALARADNGLDARWRALHAYTGDSPVAMTLRLGVAGFFVLLNLLPLLLRIWRGETEQDRRVAARRLRNRAEEEADTAIALKRAQVRAERELRLQDELLRAPLAETVHVTVPAGGRELEPHRGGPLDALPGPLPRMAKAFGGLMRPLVPAPVARLAETVPLRTARTLLEEVEEFQFSLLRKRKVTLTEEKPDDGPAQPETGEPALRRSAVATRILDPTAESRDALGHGGRSEPRKLPPGRRRELPPGPGEQ